jgi:acyl-CoA thioesterase II
MTDATAHGWAHEACPYLARAWWGDRLVAESTAAQRVEPPAGTPQLWFPLADVRLDELLDEGRTTTWPEVGPARLWSLEPRPGPPVDPTGRSTSDWHASAADPTDGRDGLWSLTEPTPELAWLSGLATFDHDRVRVELVDAAPGDDPRDVTVKRFPVWGDTADLIALLDVAPAGDGAYLSSAVRADERRPVVEGSQMLGQAIVAASRHTGGRRVVSAHMVFLRAADSRLPLRFELDERMAGRTFTTIAVDVRQGERLCATGTLLLDETAPDLVRHAVAPPETPGPYESERCDMSVMGRDIRIVDGAYTSDPAAPVGPPTLDAWVRFRDVPADAALHAGLLAQFTGHLSIAAALRPHVGVSQAEAHRTLSMAINSIAISFHADVRADQWMRYHHHSTFAGDGMTHAECQVHDEDVHLLASFTVDAMVRAFPEATAADDRTAL